MEIVSLANESERLGWREKLGEVLCEKTMYVTEVMNKHEFVPKMPNSSDLELVFDTSFHDVHSHLWVVSGLGLTVSGSCSRILCLFRI